MRATLAVTLAILLGGCSIGQANSAQVAELQKQVASLSQQVQALQVGSAAAERLDLQQVCSDDAERAFKTLGYDASKPTNGITAAVFSHYNPTVQRCFMLLSTYNIQGLETTFLSDANENMPYGTLMAKGNKILQCEMTSSSETTLCSTKQQWEQYVVRYMGRVPR